MDRTGKLKKKHIVNECTEPNDVMFYVLFIFYTIRIHNLWLKYLHVCLFSVMFLLLNIQWTKSTEKKNRCVRAHTHAQNWLHLSPSSDGRVQSPRNVCCSQHQNTIIVVTHSLHLNQKLCFNASRWFRLIFISGAAEGIHLINENDWWLVLSSQLK